MTRYEIALFLITHAVVAWAAYQAGWRSGRSCVMRVLDSEVEKMLRKRERR